MIDDPVANLVVARDGDTTVPSTSVEVDQAAGNDHFRAGRLEEALAAYLEGVRRDPTCVTLRTNAALTAIKLGRWPVAMEHANTALVLTKGRSAKAWFHRGTVFLAINTCPLAAFYDFKSANSLEPHDKEVKCHLYDLRSTLGSVYPNWTEFPERRLDPFWRSVLLHMNLDQSPLVSLYWDDVVDPVQAPEPSA